mgnify:CR=1 FL=1
MVEQVIQLRQDAFYPVVEWGEEMEVRRLVVPP